MFIYCSFIMLEERQQVQLRTQEFLQNTTETLGLKCSYDVSTKYMSIICQGPSFPLIKHFRQPFIMSKIILFQHTSPCK
uniref:Uncharacterized protein n=1 Tax=Arundo donax TaxID=35708 RepID=A0A0A9DXD7_ARUDO